MDVEQDPSCYAASSSSSESVEAGEGGREGEGDAGGVKKAVGGLGEGPR